MKIIILWAFQLTSLMKTLPLQMILIIISWLVHNSDDSVAKTKFRNLILWIIIFCERRAHLIFTTVPNTPQLSTCRTPVIEMLNVLMREVHISQHTVKTKQNATNISYKVRRITQNETLRHTNNNLNGKNEKNKWFYRVLFRKTRFHWGRNKQKNIY